MSYYTRGEWDGAAFSYGVTDWLAVTATQDDPDAVTVKVADAPPLVLMRAEAEDLRDALLQAQQFLWATRPEGGEG